MNNNVSKDKKTILITSIIIGFILLICIIVSIIINNLNAKFKNDIEYIYIYQYEVKDFNIDYNSEKILYKKIKFDYNTNYDEIITSLDGLNYNHIVIKNGQVLVNDSSCVNKICMKSVIKYKQSLLNNLDIICMPNGLVITLERS